MKPIATFHVPGRVKPKIRWGLDRWTKRVKDYQASQDVVRHAAREAVPTPWPIRRPVRIGVAWYVTPKKGTDRPRMTDGDWEGVFGAVADALAKSVDGLPVILEGDDLTRVVGPGDAIVNGRAVPCGGYLVGTHGTTEPGVHVTLWEAA